MKKLLVLTDIHIRGEGQTIIGLDPLERFTAALAHAMRQHSDADHLILTGDLTHSGQVTEYERLKDALGGLLVPVSLMLGNHDRRDHFLRVFPQTPVTAAGHVQRVLDLGTHRAILLDTLDGPPFRPAHHSGWLCPDRLSWLEQELIAASGQPVIIFLHHPPFKVGFKGMDDIRLENDQKFLALVRRFPNVAHLVCGHIHRTISGNVNGLAFTIFKSPCHQMPLDFVSPDSSLSTAEPGAYGVILLNEGQITLHSEDFDLAKTGGISGYDTPPHTA